MRQGPAKAAGSFAALAGDVDPSDRCGVLVRQHRDRHRPGQASEVTIAAVVIATIVMFFFAQHQRFHRAAPHAEDSHCPSWCWWVYALLSRDWNPSMKATSRKGYAYFAMAFSFVVELLNMRVRRHHQQRKAAVGRVMSAPETA